MIPCVIYQTWKTKDLPPKMKEQVELLKSQNPGFIFHLYDDNDCREFIKIHFKHDVLWAYDNLIPGAYKADLWRYCVLFINGGYYLDIKFNCVNNFKLYYLSKNEHFVLDRGNYGIYNAFFVCRKGNPLLFLAIRQIVVNVKKKYYGSSPLDPTGPGLLKNIINKRKIIVNIDLKHFEQGGFITYKNDFIMSTTYSEYDIERSETYNKNNTKRYDKLWNEKRIYL
jgi:mannosyltransferase OCH1-like enzyme